MCPRVSMWRPPCVSPLSSARLRCQSPCRHGSIINRSLRKKRYSRSARYRQPFHHSLTCNHSICYLSTSLHRRSPEAQVLSNDVFRALLPPNIPALRPFCLLRPPALRIANTSLTRGRVSTFTRVCNKHSPPAISIQPTFVHLLKHIASRAGECVRLKKPRWCIRPSCDRPTKPESILVPKPASRSSSS